MRHAPRPRGAALLCIAAIAAGCAALTPQPTQDPGPTQLDPPAGTPVEVAVDNRSDEPLALTFSQQGKLGPHLVLGACEATSLAYPLDGPFTVGLGSAADFANGPMPPLVESVQLPRVGGEYRVLVRIGADGEVTFGRLEGAAPVRGAGQC